jgi:hypothetical protein
VAWKKRKDTWTHHDVIIVSPTTTTTPDIIIIIVVVVVASTVWFALLVNVLFGFVHSSCFLQLL